MKRTNQPIKKQAKKRKCPECPCGSYDQSCIVARRYCEDWVHEDDVFNEAKLPLRENCLTPWTDEQKKAMDMAMTGYDSVSKSITTRWEIDGE